MMNVIRSGSVLAGAHLVRDAADRDEVARAKQRDRLFVGDPLAVERLLEDRVRGVATVGSPVARLHEAQLGDHVELAGVARELEERVQAGALARPEAVAELLEVAGEEARPDSRSARRPRSASCSGSARAARTDATSASSSSSRSGMRPAREPPRRRTPSAGRCARARAGRGRGAVSDPRRPTCSAASPIRSFASASPHRAARARPRAAAPSSVRPTSPTRV